MVCHFLPFFLVLPVLPDWNGFDWFIKKINPQQLLTIPFRFKTGTDMNTNIEKREIT